MAAEFIQYKMGKVNGYILLGSNSAISYSASLLDGGQLFTERIYSSWSKFFPVSVDSYWKDLFSREANMKSQNLSPFRKMS